LLRDRGLADAGLTDHHHQPAVSREGGLESGVELFDLGFSADEGVAIDRVLTFGLDSSFDL
jgi:hypothetical protein